MLAQLFQPLIVWARKPARAGTGIGLVVSKRLAELMGRPRRGKHRRVGSVLVRTQLGAAPTLRAKAANPRPCPTGSPAGVSTRTVLYVEDNPANMELVKELFTRSRYIAGYPRMEFSASSCKVHSPEVS